MDDEKVYWIWLAETFGQGSVLASRLIQRFGSPKDIFDGAADSLTVDFDFTEPMLATIRQKLKKPSLDRAADILARCEYKGIDVLTFDSPDYPAPLRSLRDMPLVLYKLGDLPDCTPRLLTTVVGTRKMTDYGRRIAYSLGAGLAFGGAVHLHCGRRTDGRQFVVSQFLERHSAEDEHRLAVAAHLD